MKTPTQSPTHADIDPSRIANMGMDLDDIAKDDVVALDALIELAEDRGRPASHYLAALALATDFTLAPHASAKLELKICVGNCQQYGALDLVDRLITRACSIRPVTCLDRCDRAPACELHGGDATLVLAPATVAAVDEALGELA